VSEIVDLVFPLAGNDVCADYALPLWQALSHLLPWLGEDNAFGILPIKGASASAERLLLTRRAQLALRLPRHRLADAAVLAGQTLQIGTEVRMGQPSPRELRPTSAQYSPLVVFTGDSEAEFFDHCTRQLDAMAIRANIVCGKAQARQGEAGELRGFSLMLHELTREHALRLQQQGLGTGRKLGCGIFIPHKTAYAVGGAA